MRGWHIAQVMALVELLAIGNAGLAQGQVEFGARVRVATDLEPLSVPQLGV